MAQMTQPAVQQPKQSQPEPGTGAGTGARPGEVISLPAKRASKEEEQVAVLWFFSM